jgi:AcrR family transcriptional regulator
VTSSPNRGDEGVRDAVLRAATRLIGDHGMDGMTMRQVAEAAGVSTGTVNYHFRNKRGLILAAMDTAGISPEVSSTSSALGRIEALLSTFVLEDEPRRAWWRFWVEATAQAARDPALRARQHVQLEAQRREVEELVTLGIRAGELRPELDAAVLAEPLLALAHGLVLLQVTAPEAATVQRAADALAGSLRELAAR